VATLSVTHNFLNSGEFQLFGLFFCSKTQLHNFSGSGNLACGFHLVEMHHNSFVVAELDRVALVYVPLDHLIGTNPKRVQLGSRDGRWTKDPNQVTCLELQLAVSIIVELVLLLFQLFIQSLVNTSVELSHMVHEGIRRRTSGFNLRRETTEWLLSSENHVIGLLTHTWCHKIVADCQHPRERLNPIGRGV